MALAGAAGFLAPLVETAAARAMTIDELAGYWAVNNHAPEGHPTGRSEIHADWTTARESLAGDMAVWAAYVDGHAAGVPAAEGWLTMTERVEEVISDELAGLPPGADFTVTLVDDATPHERIFTLQPMAAIPTLDAAQHQDQQQLASWVDRLGPVPEDPAARLEWAERAGAVAAYQEIIGGSDDDPLGAWPGPGQPDIRARWESANQALNGPPVAAARVTDEELQGRVDRAGQLVADAPDIVVDRLRQAHHDARDERTRAELVGLDGPSDADAEKSTAAARPTVAGPDLERLEEAQQRREDWVTNHGAEVAAGPPATAELARREDERAARPFIDLDDDQLHRTIRSAQDDVVALDRRASERVGVIEVYGRQAQELDDEAQTVEWNHPTWATLNQERQAETDAAARLAAIDTRLDRSALRGGPRTEERAQMHVEALQLRSAHPTLNTGADRAPMWDERAENAWAQDKATADQFRGDATILRSKAERVTATLGPLADQRQQAQDRLNQLVDERRHRQAEPPWPAPDQGVAHGPGRDGRSLQPVGSGSPVPTVAGRRHPDRDGPTPAEARPPDHTPGVDPSQPLTRLPGPGPER